MNYNFAKNKLLATMSPQAVEFLKAYNAIIAGGAITSVFCNRVINDIDVYFKSESDLIGFVCELYESKGFEFIVTNVTNKSMLVLDSKTQQYIQLIHYKYFPTIKDVFADFDFTVCMGAYDMANDKFEFDERFFPHNSQRYIHFHEGTAFPLISALRVQKYVEKGYTIPKAQMLRILMKINSLNLNSWDDLKEHIGGMYGLDMNTVFPETEQFDMNVVIDKLDQIEAELSFENPSMVNVPKMELSHVLSKLIKPNSNRTAASTKLFKNAVFDGEVYRSHWDKRFIYPIGGVVNGGRNGIYAYRGYDVLTGIYNDAYNNVILELEHADDTGRLVDAMALNKLQMVGNVRVVAAYDKVEFIRKFINDKVMVSND